MGKIQKEVKAIQGMAAKDRTYSSENTFSDEETAEKAFQKSVEKLFDVNRWSDLPGLSSSFQLYNQKGEEIQAHTPQVHDYIKILLPGPLPENWVVVTDLKKEENSVEFTVSPSINPTAKGKEREEIRHFFIKEATSTFRIERLGKTITAYEIGRNEVINNHGKEAGHRELINTLIAEGGWAGFQGFQWNKLTDYLVHKIEINQ